MPEHRPDDPPDDPDDAPAALRGPYDPDPSDEADLWFLPAPEVAEEDAPPDPVPEVAAWAGAEAGLAAPLADLAALSGAFGERLRDRPGGVARLALMEAAELSWWAGARIGADRIALWTGARLGAGDEGQALARVAWAARRLGSGPGPETDIAGFLGRTGEDFAGRAADWRAAMEGAAGLHRITRAAFGFHLWPLAAPGIGRMEAAVVAARLAAPPPPARRRHRDALFLPLALAGAGGLRPGGDVSDRLRRWIAGAEASVLAALLHLERVAAWQARTVEAIAPLKGATPPKLAALLADRPHLSAPEAEAATGASRAAVQRNLAWMQERGLIREVTGQGRYRVWAAKV